MKKYTIQINEEVREATLEEVAQIEAQRAASKAEDDAKEAKAIARNAVLAKLGLSAEEAAALLG